MDAGGDKLKGGEGEPGKNVRLFEEVLYLPPRLVEDIRGTKGIRGGLGIVVQRIAEQLSSEQQFYGPGAQARKEINRVAGRMSVGGDKDKPADFVERTAQVDQASAEAIRQVAFRGQTMKEAMSLVGVSFPSGLDVHMGKPAEVVWKDKDGNEQKAALPEAVQDIYYFQFPNRK